MPEHISEKCKIQCQNMRHARKYVRENTRTMSDKTPDRMSEYMSDRIPEWMSDRLPDRMPENMPDRMP